jgi:hypothetical protein
MVVKRADIVRVQRSSFYIDVFTELSTAPHSGKAKFIKLATVSRATVYLFPLILHLHLGLERGGGRYSSGN